MIPLVLFQYNEELHYVEPCLNGTLVQADVTNKDVSSSFVCCCCFPFCFFLTFKRSFGVQRRLIWCEAAGKHAGSMESPAVKTTATSSVIRFTKVPFCINHSTLWNNGKYRLLYSAFLPNQRALQWRLIHQFTLTLAHCWQTRCGSYESCQAASTLTHMHCILNSNHNSTKNSDIKSMVSIQSFSSCIQVFAPPLSNIGSISPSNSSKIL